MKRPKFCLNLVNFSSFTWLQPGYSVVSANDDETARVNEGRRVSSKSPWLARAVEEVMSKETDETWFKSFVKSWRLTLKLDSDHSCSKKHTWMDMIWLMVKFCDQAPLFLKAKCPLFFVFLTSMPFIKIYLWSHRVVALLAMNLSLVVTKTSPKLKVPVLKEQGYIFMKTHPRGPLLKEGNSVP